MIRATLAPLAPSATGTGWVVGSLLAAVLVLSACTQPGDQVAIVDRSHMYYGKNQQQAAARHQPATGGGAYASGAASGSSTYARRDLQDAASISERPAEPAGMVGVVSRDLPPPTLSAAPAPAADPVPTPSYSYDSSSVAAAQPARPAVAMMEVAPGTYEMQNPAAFAPQAPAPVTSATPTMLGAVTPALPDNTVPATTTMASARMDMAAAPLPAALPANPPAAVAPPVETLSPASAESTLPAPIAGPVAAPAIAPVTMAAADSAASVDPYEQAMAQQAMHDSGAAEAASILAPAAGGASPSDAADAPAAQPTAPVAELFQFTWPVSGEVISRYGPKSGGQYNDGINIALAEGEPIHAAAAGTVIYAGNALPGYGNMVMVRHTDGWVTSYGHARTLLVNKGDTVAQGQAIAEVGATGSVQRPQLHFSIRHGRKPVDPLAHLGTTAVADNQAASGTAAPTQP